MATAQEMQAFENNARYIHLTSPKAIAAIALRHFKVPPHLQNTLNALLSAPTSQEGSYLSTQFRDNDGRLCWIQGRTDPLGIPHISLRFQANEWPEGQEPLANMDESKHLWGIAVVNTRERLAARLHALSDGLRRSPEEVAFDKGIEALMRNGNNVAGEPIIEADLSMGKHPLIISSTRLYPKYPHHWTASAFEAMLREQNYPPNTIPSRVEEHTQTLQHALRFGKQLPAQVIASPEGQIAIEAAVSSYRAAQTAAALENHREERSQIVQALLGSLAERVSTHERSIGQSPARAAIALAIHAQDSSQEGSSLLARPLGRSAQVVHPLIAFPLRVTYITRHIDHGGADTSGKALPRHAPPQESCALLIEDARLPLGNAWATMASIDAERVGMAVRDMAYANQITSAQVAQLLGSQWAQNYLAGLQVDVISSLQDTAPEDKPQRAGQRMCG